MPRRGTFHLVRLGLLLGLAAAEALPAAEPPRGVLTLASGDAVAGAFVPSPAGDTIRWHGADFTQPFDFPLSAVATAQFPPEQPLPKLGGNWAIECLTGDVLTGQFSGWTAESIVFDTIHFGRVHVRPDALRRLYRLNDNPTVVLPSLAGLLGWRTNGKTWREDGPQIETQEDGAMVVGDFDLPDAAVVEFEISWTGTPGFVLALGVDPQGDADKPQEGWRFEVWGSDLTIVREQELTADVDRVQTLEASIKRVHLFAYLSQATGSLHVFHAGGTPAGSVTVAPEAGRERGRGVRLINRNGTVRLDHLRIARWNGVLPFESAVDQAHCQLADGRTVAGRIVGLSADGATFQVRSGDTEQSIPATDLLAAELTLQSADRAGPAAVILQDGTRISGAVDASAADRLVVRSPHIAEAIAIPYPSLRSVMVFDSSASQAAEGRSGRLEIGDLKLQGSLVPHVETAEEHVLAFQPAGGLTSSPLRSDAAGRIVYRDAPKVRAASPAQQEPQAVQPAGRNFAEMFLKKAREPAAAKLPTKHNLYLRSGDVIPCTITAIDEEGVSIASEVATATLVPHAKIKAAELIPNAKPPELADVKKSRLLTLPRLQKASPPTHLVCSRTGDFLRGRLISLGPDVVKMEVQLGEYDVPRDRVSQIIWFHPDEMTADDAANALPQLNDVSTPAAAVESAAVGEPFGRGLVQAIERSGNRITFDPVELAGTTLSGHSDVLGDCRVDVGTIDELVFGTDIAAAVTGLPYQDWRLQPAVEPLVAQDSGSDGATEGEVSPLVGKPAPEINLELLAGGKFRLSECRGQIVLLDFWASWCGPCMQTMPLVEAAAAEFDPQQVRLVSINLEEPAEHVRGVLERQQLHVPVALDIDGVTARKYEANAIPQLVIVDRDGNIARLYIGGGPDVVEQVKAAVEALLNPTADASPTTPPAT